MITLELHGDPIPQGRPRFSKRGNFVTTYDPHHKIKEGYKWQLKSQYREELMTGPIILSVTFFMPIPKSTSGIKKRQMANGIIHHIKKPDVDNLLKLVCDALNQTIFSDDSQIIEVRAKKIYSNNPGTSIRIIPLNAENKETLYEDISRENR